MAMGGGGIGRRARPTKLCHFAALPALPARQECRSHGKSYNPSARRPFADFVCSGCHYPASRRTVDAGSERRGLTTARVAVQSKYVLCASSALSLLWLLASGGLSGMFPTDLFGPVVPLAEIACVALALAFLLIATRRYWWGKLLCVVVALSGIGSAALSCVMEFEAPVAWVAAAGFVLLSTAIVHQIAYPEFGS